jgi:hypothetical protein
MKVFISWSGERSKSVANSLYDWLPTIIQSLKPWMSEYSIDKGTRSIPAISQNLEETQFGIICLTPENLESPWLLFEAGALSKSQSDSRVWTFLYDLDYVNVQGPLSQFQHTIATENDIKKLLQAINNICGTSSLTDQQLQIAFQRGWPELDKMLKCIPPFTEAAPSKRSDRELMEESLTILRRLDLAEDDSYFAPISNADNKLWSSLEVLKHRFDLVESQSVPPMDLRSEAEALILKARKLRSDIKKAYGDTPLRFDVLWRELMRIKAKINSYTEEEIKKIADQ